MLDRGESKRNEKTRLCPSCRMEISVLATKCRYCNEPVGRPKEEARQLSVEDLGGNDRRGTQYTISGSVMDALEAFRASECDSGGAQNEPPPRKKRRRRAAPEPSAPCNGDDFISSGYGSDDFSSSGANDDPAPRPTPRVSGMSFGSTPRPAPRRDGLTLPVWGVIALAAVLVALVVGGLFVFGGREQLVNYPDNRAMEILADGGSELEALEAAVAAVEQAETDENIAVLEQVRQATAQRIEGLLNANPWTMDHLKQASNLVNRAVDIDGRSQVLNALQKEVTRENYAYNTVVSVNASNGNGERTATFRVTRPGEQPIQLVRREGDTVAGRFLIRYISSDGVRCEDTLRKTSRGKNRIVFFDVLGGVRQE